MKLAPVTGATILFALAGCSGMPNAFNPQPAAITAGGTYYCWQERLNDAGPNLVCNWQRSQADACNAQDLSSIAKASAAGEARKTHRCENGQWLVAVTTR
jgi:hypothetical protein